MAQPTADTTVITVGPSKLYVATASAALVLPTAADIDDLAAGTFTGFTYLGDTTAGTTVSDVPSISYATTKQAARAVAAAVTSIETKVETSLRGASVKLLANLAHGTSSSSAAAAGGLGIAKEFAIAIVGPWGEGDLLFTAARCVIDGGLNLTFDNDFTDVPVSFTVLDNGPGDAYTFAL